MAEEAKTDTNKYKAIFDKISKFDYEDTLKTILQNTRKPNILVCGGTGTGKSSLINYLFGERVADVGSGKPVTNEVRKYASETASVVLYDTVGYEVGEEQQKNFYARVIEFVKQRNRRPTIAEHIHLVWYCLSTASKRVTDTDLRIIRELSKLTKLAVVLTQVDEGTAQEVADLQAAVKAALPERPLFLVSVDERIPREKLGWDKLVEWSLKNLDSGLRLAFTQALDHQLELKRIEADKLIRRYVIAAGAAVASPLPMTDSAALLAIQTTMATHIFNFWGIDQGSEKIKKLFVSVVVANIGRLASRMLLKLVPGVGTITNLVVNTGVATSFTYAFGRAMNELCYKLAQKVAAGQYINLETAFSMELLMQLIERYYKK